MLNKQTATVASSVPVKKLPSIPTNIHQEIQKQEQPFTVVVASNRHKSGTTTSSQQNKSIETTSSTTIVSTSLIEQQTPVQIQHE